MKTKKTTTSIDIRKHRLAARYGAQEIVKICGERLKRIAKFIEEDDFIAALDTLDENEEHLLDVEKWLRFERDEQRKANNGICPQCDIACAEHA